MSFSKIFELADRSLTCVLHNYHGAVVITTAQLHSIKPDPRFGAGSNPASSVLEIRNGEDL